MNYTQLVQAIKDYTESTETSFVSHINEFIQQAEKKIYNEVQLPYLRKNVTGNTTSGNKYVQTPTDFLAVYSIAIIDSSSDQHFLLNKDVNFIREAYAGASTQAQPKYYALFDHNTFILGPTPNSAYDVELHYYYYPTSIVTASTTWLGDNYEQALLYACLVQAYTYLKGDPDLMANYQKQYQENMVQLKMLGDGKDRRDAYRSGQVRYEVK
tara:strand:- start:80 stop:715 length:636 start_codon:yes stop_codon:yes gene_type:complete